VKPDASAIHTMCGIANNIRHREQIVATADLFGPRYSGVRLVARGEADADSNLDLNSSAASAPSHLEQSLRRRHLGDERVAHLRVTAVDSPGITGLLTAVL
jgi:hypothetical protein